MPRRRPALAFLATLLVTAGGQACGPPRAIPAPTPVEVTPVAPVAPSASPVPNVLPGSSSANDQQPSVDAALRDAADHLGLPVADLHISQVEAHEWGDASLGCPRAGIMYAQIVTPGFLIVVNGGGRELEYHTDSRGQVVLCQER